MRTRLRFPLGAFAGLLAALAASAAGAQETAAEASGLVSGDVAWVLTSSAIVLMMTIPGLAFFYGGLVRDRNVLSIFMLCFVTAALVSVIWILWGYSIAFGNSIGGLFGDLSKAGLRGVSWIAGPEDTIPEQLFMVFQLMFAIITPALIVGAVAERMKFSAFVLFVLFWSTFIYAPLAHWAWGDGGWASEMGALDFAGGTVVHISSGASALVAAAMIGRRRGYGRPAPPHNVPFVVAGAALLWVGWFGFNAGSALAADGLAVVAFVNTNTATGAAVLGWLISEWIGKGKPTAVGAATGAVAGLVAITPGAGFVEPWAAILIGAVAGFLCYKACNWKVKVGYDDALDVVGVHGVGGVWGALATGLFASTLLAGEGGWFTNDNFGQFLTQIYSVLATVAFCAVGTAIILSILNGILGIRVDEEVEAYGLDLALHAENAYSQIGPGGASEAPQQTPARERRTPALGKRRPPGPERAKREAPRTPPAAAAAAVGGRSAPQTQTAARATQPARRRFRITVEGVEPGSLSKWWTQLCNQDSSKLPPAFREVHGNLRTFEGDTFHFRAGDPGEIRERLAYLLDIYGVPSSGLRVAEA